jgi:enolase
MKTSVKRVYGRQILDSRGRPTVEVEVSLADGTVGRASVPSGASTGRHEALELRDADIRDYAGLSVRKAVENVDSSIDGALRGRDASEQASIDGALCALDGTPNLSRLGANAVLATSLAVCRAASASLGMPLYRYIARLTRSGIPSLPMPMANILSGGAHAGRGMDVQDFLVVPTGARTYSEALAMIGNVRTAAAEIMRESNLSILLADEGGLSPRFPNADDAMVLMMRAFERAGLSPGEDVGIALDIAASELRSGIHYRLEGAQRTLSSQQMADYLVDLVKRYPVVSIEDALDQDDWNAWRPLTAALSSIQVVGDDLFATNPQRLADGIEQQIGNAVLIKVNQNGTLSGALNVLNAARKAGYASVVSARSGETEDNFIADLAVGSGAGQIKIGSVRNSERLSKYNQLLRIEEDRSLLFAGMSGFSGTAVRNACLALGTSSVAV